MISFGCRLDCEDLAYITRQFDTVYHTDLDCLMTFAAQAYIDWQDLKHFGVIVTLTDGFGQY